MHLALFYSTILYYYIWQSCEAGLPRALRLQLQPCGSSSLFFSFSLFPLLLLFFFSSSSLHFFSISSSLVLFFLALSSAFLHFFFYCCPLVPSPSPTHAAAIGHTPQSTVTNTASLVPLLLALKWSIPGNWIFYRRFFNRS